VFFEGRHSGLTLTEMLVVLLLAAVVLAVGVPLTLTTLRANRRDGAARRVLAEIRAAQSTAATRGGVYAWQWGPDENLPATQFRIVRDGGDCELPDPGANPDGSEVVRGWFDLGRAHGDVTIESVRDDDGRSLGAVMFNPMGASVNTCEPVSFPVRVTLIDGSGATRVIEIRGAGGTSLR
jgi:prepilin-type N-terminal cleavage/methylation domain-containing protein